MASAQTQGVRTARPTGTLKGTVREKEEAAELPVFIRSLTPHLAQSTPAASTQTLGRIALLALQSHFLSSSFLSFLTSLVAWVACEAREPMAFRMASLLGSTPGRFSSTLWRNSGSCITS